MNEATYKDFLVEYPFEGWTWCIKVSARSHQEAIERVKQFPFAKVKGEIVVTIPLGGEKFWSRVLRWCRFGPQ